MPEIIGRQIEVGVSLEATRGTVGVSMQKAMKYLTTSFQEKIEKVEDKSQHSAFDDADGHRVTKKWIEGDLQGNVHADGIGYLLASYCGSVASVVVLASVKDHTFTLLQSAIHPSLSVYLKDGNVRQKAYNGCLVTSLEFSANTDDYVQFTAGLMGRTGVADAKAFNYSATEYDFIGKEITVKMADTLAGLTGATPTLVKEVKIKLENGSKADYVLGNYNPNEIYGTKSSIEVSLTKNFQDETFKTLLESGASKYVQIAIVGEALLDASNHPQLTFVLNNAKVADWSKKGNTDDLVTEEITLKGYYNSTDTKAYSVVLRNLTSGYATGV